MFPYTLTFIFGYNLNPYNLARNPKSTSYNTQEIKHVLWFKMFGDNSI